MTDQDLIAGLKALGLDRDSFRAVALLPLIEVAWADREVQPAERKLILEVAEGHRLLAPGARAVLDRWLAEAPDEATFARGRELLIALAHRTTGVDVDLRPQDVDTMLDLCGHVAEAAGGLFGLAFTTSAEERRAIRRIGEHLRALEPEPEPLPPDPTAEEPPLPDDLL